MKIDKKELAGFSLVLAIVLILLLFRDALILFCGKWPHLYAVINTTTLSWEEIYCYTPFANRVSLTNLFPALPNADPFFAFFTNFPFLAIWVQGVILKILAGGNPDVYLLIMHVLFPVLSFTLLYLVYRRFISQSWALLFSFLGVITYGNFSYLAFLCNLIATGINWSSVLSLSSLSPLELSRAPSPSFTFFYFILCFYLTIANIKPSFKRIVGLSLLWGLNLYVYVFNFIVGAMFWLAFLFYSSVLVNKKIECRDIAIKVGIAGALLALIALPLVGKTLFFATPIDAQVLDKMGMVTRYQGLIYSLQYFISYFAIPVLVVLAVIRIFSFDYYELFYKFSPILILLFIEFLILNLHILFGRFMQPHLFSTRLANYFFHYFYFVPVIYYLSNPPKTLFHNPQINQKVAQCSTFIREYIIEKRIYFIPVIIAFVSMISLVSSVRNYDNYRQKIEPRMPAISERLALLTGKAAAGEVVIAADPAVNILVPAITRQGSLWVNAFNNYESTDRIVERLALFARLYGWDEARYLEFMMPSKIMKNIYTDRDFIFTDQVYRQGFGYWLVNHNMTMNAAELRAYKNSIVGKYNGVDIKMGLEKYRVRFIGSAVPLRLPVRNKVVAIKDKYKVYEVISVQ
ncbi:MAG: hypothetical protein KKC80_05440 [Candidatus Margulisbacteria bacterium]|nr:hypothetical protein [Candidatus Margulisiibacteriota bacterium]MBU1617138.1 hypothetical protein [Candidatus Margulisiibacteriota bacterium]